jgi:hypothetical protein
MHGGQPVLLEPRGGAPPERGRGCRSRSSTGAGRPVRYTHQQRYTGAFAGGAVLQTNDLDAGAASGTFAYSLLTPKERGVGAIGLYFYEGRLGLYPPLLFDDPERYPNLSLRGFIECIYAKYGIRLGGIGQASGPEPINVADLQ